MAHITVNLQTPNGLTYDDTLIPEKYTVEEIIDDVITQLNFPTLSRDNKPIKYSLLSVDTGTPLEEGLTLREEGVGGGSSIRLIASVEISIDPVSTTFEDALTTSGSIESALALRIFLCHSSGDKPAVTGLYRRLVADGFAPWLDEEDLLPGQDWDAEIRRAVQAANVVLVCLSEKSVNKAGYVQKEIKYALDISDQQPQDAIFLIPLKLEECNVPERLKRWQWVNLFDERGYERLLKALSLKANQVSLKLG